MFKAFNAWLVLLAATIIFLLLWKFLKPLSCIYPIFRGISREKVYILVLIFIVIISALNFFFFHDTLFGTRDEGLYANDAIYLSRHGELPFPRFKDFDTRLFLNTVWNAEMYGLAGYTGLRLCNILPFTLALICIFLLARDLSGETWAGLFAIALISLSYPFLWYARRTANEVFFFSLFWIFVYYFYRCLRTKGSFKTEFTIFLLIAPLVAFVRPEGLVVLAVGALGALYLYFRFGRRNNSYPLILFILLFMVMALSLWGGYEIMNTKYNLGGFIKKTISNFQDASEPTLISENAIFVHKPAYTTMAMIKFGVMPGLVLIFPFILLLFLDRENSSFAVFLTLLILPFAYYYFEPNIYFDFPWFLRRFLTVIIPLSYVAFCVVIFKLKKSQAMILAVTYLALTIYISVPVIFHQDYKGMVTKLNDIASAIPSEEKVLVDRYALGDFGVDLPLSLVYDRDALQVTPWNPISYDKIGFEGRLYFLTNFDNFKNKYGEGKTLFDETVNIDRMEIVKEIDITTTFLQPTCEFHCAGNENSWTSMDWRIALSNVEVPSKKIIGVYKLLIVSMDISTASAKQREGL
ncbi:hypothetical protein [Candidatus Solincola sp.]